MTEEKREAISFGRRLSELASTHPGETAIHFVQKSGEERTLSWSEFDLSSNRVARFLAELGTGVGSTVVIGLPNSIEHFLVVLGAWKLGACTLPLSSNLPQRERDQILEIAEPAVVVSDWEGLDHRGVSRDGLKAAESMPPGPLPDRIAHPGKAIASGGSTGRPKIIVDPAPWAKVPGDAAESLGRYVGFRTGQVQLVAGPLYHNAPFCWSHWGLFEDHKLVLMERFDAALAVDLIERHRVSFGFMVPTMMRRIIQLPNIGCRDFSSIQAIFHTAAPCAAWLKQAWIDLIGGQKLYEAFGATEAMGFTSIRGDDWLAHPGSVGQPRTSDLRILDDEGREVAPGIVGEIFMRPWNTDVPSYEYRGSAPAKTTQAGFVSVGDMGWVDREGYVYLADRRVDMIISGGANIYPAEVESTLTEHPSVSDVAVIGLADEDWGKRIHAVVQLRNPSEALAIEELDKHCRARLAAYKVPKSYEYVERLPRDDSGKIRRQALAAEREPQSHTD